MRVQWARHGQGHGTERPFFLPLALPLAHASAVRFLPGFRCRVRARAGQPASHRAPRSSELAAAQPGWGSDASASLPAARPAVVLVAWYDGVATLVAGATHPPRYSVHVSGRHRHAVPGVGWASPHLTPEPAGERGAKQVTSRPGGGRLVSTAPGTAVHAARCRWPAGPRGNVSASASPVPSERVPEIFAMWTEQTRRER